MSRKDKKGRVLRKGESQRKDGLYQYRYQDFLGNRQTIYSWRLVESDRLPEGKQDSASLREREKEIEEVLSLGIAGAKSDITLNQMFDSYVVRKKHKGKALKDNTTNNYCAMYDKHIRNTIWGEMKVADICKPNIIDLLNNLLDDGVSYGTALFFKKVLSGVFNLAIDDGIMEKNPTLRVMNEIEGQQERREALTVEQQEDLLAYVKCRNFTLYSKIMFLVETMCRISEMAGITWDDIDMKNRIVTIDHQLVYKKFREDKITTYHITETKGYDSRVIPMSEELFDILRKVKKYYFLNRTDEVVDGRDKFVFCTPARTLLNSAQFNTELKRLVKEYNKTAEYPIENICPHMLRHTGCTRYAEDGMDIKVLQQLMGHKSPQTTMNIYNHVQEERARKEMERVAELRRNRA